MTSVYDFIAILKADKCPAGDLRVQKGRLPCTVCWAVDHESNLSRHCRIIKITFSQKTGDFFRDFRKIAQHGGKRSALLLHLVSTRDLRSFYTIRRVGSHYFAISIK